MARRVPLPPQNSQHTWADQMALEKVGEFEYRSLVGSPSAVYTSKNGVDRPRAFGGHVYAQAVYAASRTVQKGMLIHSVTGYFTLLGLADEPFTYTVTPIRSGGNYSVRSVTVRQDEDPTTVFTCICSFKRSEPDFLRVQEGHDIRERFRPFLGNSEPDDLPLVTDGKDWRSTGPAVPPGVSPQFSGMHISVLPLEKEYASRAPIEREHLYFFRANGRPSAEPDYNLEACAHLFHSDRESVWAILRSYELLDILHVGSSLSHTVVFHVPGSDLSFHDESGRERWFYQETKCRRISDGRALHEGRIYGRDGTLVASVMQDSAIKLREMTQAEKRRREVRLNSRERL